MSKIWGETLEGVEAQIVEIIRAGPLDARSNAVQHTTSDSRGVSCSFHLGPIPPIFCVRITRKILIFVSFFASSPLCDKKND